MNIHDACFNLYFATCEEHDPLKPQDDPQQFSSEGHADSLYHPAVEGPGVCVNFDNPQSWCCSLEGALIIARHENGDVAQLDRASDRHTADAGSIPQCGKGFFSQGQLPVQTLLRVSVTPCAIACINICAHVKDPVAHVRVRWIMETLKHSACTEGWVARLCCSCLSPGKSNLNSTWGKSHWDKTGLKSLKKKKFKLLA